MTDDYDDETPVREIPNGPLYVSPELRRIKLRRRMERQAEVEKPGHTLPRFERGENMKRGPK